MEISSKVNQFTARLGLKNSKDQVIFLFKTAMEKGKWRYGEVSHLVLSCCLYIQARIDKKPVSLSHIAVNFIYNLLFLIINFQYLIFVLKK